MGGIRNSFDLAAELRRLIDGGEWGAAGRLPPERTLAAQFAVARNTVRRALDALENGGYLTRHVGRGTFVQPRQTTLGASIVLRIREASPQDILETRLIIEPRATALAASRANAADLAAISRALAGSLAATSLADFEHWDAQLHLAIFLATKNEVLIDYCRAICEARNQPQWVHLKKRSVTAQTRAAYDSHHQLIVDALLRRDANAAAEGMREHLRMVEENIVAAA
jgi:DNA-binding FadR family transcriptional regulator